MNDKGQGLEERQETARKNGKNYLFAIAIDAYQFSPPLYNCVRDVESMLDVLYHKYQFEPSDTFKLYNEQATERNIFDTFKRLLEVTVPDDNLMIIYSGHGEYEAGVEEGYWIPVDAQLGDFSDYVSNSRIARYIKAIQAHHIVLIVDSCFSGSLFAHKELQSRSAGLRLDDIPSRWLLTAGRNEVVSDGKPGDHSPFAENVCYFLNHNALPSLSIGDLCDQVVDAVIYNSRQTPRGEPMQDVGHRGGQFFFHLKGNTVTPDGLVETLPRDAPAIAQAAATPASEQAWQAAAAKDTETAYRDFLARFPESDQAATARRKIAENYRYTLFFTPVLKNGTQLELHFGSGQPPFQVSISLPSGAAIDKNWEAKAPLVVDLAALLAESGHKLTIISIEVTDHNFKQAGQKFPIL